MNNKINGQFVGLTHEILVSAAWRDMCPGARCYVLEVWRRHNARNNGNICYSQRQAQDDLSYSSATAVKWRKEALEHGFIVPTKQGSFNLKSAARAGDATVWRLTTEPCNGQPATNEWKKWQPDKIHLTGLKTKQRRVQKLNNCPPTGSKIKPVATENCDSDGFKNQTTYRLSIPGEEEPCPCAVSPEAPRGDVLAAYRTLIIWTALVPPADGYTMSGRQFETLCTYTGHTPLSFFRRIGVDGRSVRRLLKQSKIDFSTDAMTRSMIDEMRTE